MIYIDSHIHGGYGINFNKCTEEDLHTFAKNVLKRNIVGFCPTLTGENPKVLKSRIAMIDNAMKNQSDDEALILGVHLEGTFLNPEKPGIQNAGMFLTPGIENFRKIAGEFIHAVKIVTLAPELDENCALQDYLEENGIRAHAGHSVSEELYNVTGTTHHFNAMQPLTHKKSNLALKGLLDNSVYCEIIADSLHVADDMMKLFFKVKDVSKVILVSDALPITHSGLDSVIFCGKHVYKGGRDKDGTLAGSCKFLDEIALNLEEKGILPSEDIQKMAFDNIIEHLKLDDKTKEILQNRIK